MMWDDGQYDVGWPAMVLMMVTFWALAGGAFYLAVRWLGRESRSTEPLEILDQRLASGETDVEEYDRLRQALGEHRGTALHR